MPTVAGVALAEAAAGLVGVRYRLHGRDPMTGLDCLGVLAASLQALGRPDALPLAYTLRSRNRDDLDEIAIACGLIATPPPIVAGDVAFVRIGATQSHLLLGIGERRFVHAHAGLRRVVTHDGPLAWPLTSLWRLNETIGT